MQPLAGLPVVDLTRYLPSRSRRGSSSGWVLASCAWRRLGDPLRRLAPAWHDALNVGKESVVCDLKAEPEFGRALCSRADVVVVGFRPGVAERLGLGPGKLPASLVYCSLTGFGTEGAHAERAGHDLNYLGFAGALADTSPPCRRFRSPTSPAAL